MKAGGQIPKPSRWTIPDTNEQTDEFGKGSTNRTRVKEKVQEGTRRQARLKAKVADPRTLAKGRAKVTEERPKTTQVEYPR